MKAWKMTETVEEDQRLPNQRAEDAAVEVGALEALGVRVTYLPVRADNAGRNAANDEALEAYRKAHGYVHMDVLEVSPSALPDYHQKLREFFEEHIHADEEVRYVVDGSGYFDVRDARDEWVRMHVTPGDLLVLPAGIYHRFTLDTGDYIRAIRLFREAPQWVPIPRPDAERHAARQRYVHGLRSGNGESPAVRA